MLTTNRLLRKLRLCNKTYKSSLSSRPIKKSRNKESALLNDVLRSIDTQERAPLKLDLPTAFDTVDPPPQSAQPLWDTRCGLSDGSHRT